MFWLARESGLLGFLLRPSQYGLHGVVVVGQVGPTTAAALHFILLRTLAPRVVGTVAGEALGPFLLPLGRRRWGLVVGTIGVGAVEGRKFGVEDSFGGHPHLGMAP